MATISAQYNGKNLYYFCGGCNGSHSDDPEYPGREKKEAAPLGRRYAQGVVISVQGVGRPAQGVGRPPQPDVVQCHCCQIAVDREKANKMAYVCGHTKTFCLTCASHHLNCQHDRAVLKLGSYETLVFRLQLQKPRPN